MTETTEVTAAVLKNRGCPIVLAKLDADGERKFDNEGALRTQEMWVRFDANSLSEIELRFGSMDDFEDALRSRPFASIRAALAFTLGHDEPTVGRMMQSELVDSYANAVGVSLALATGVDPTQALQLWEKGVTAGIEQRKQREKDVSDLLTLDDDETDVISTIESAASDSLGSTGSTPGAESGEQSTSSGG